MSNAFVDYLNTMNNASSNNENALAEAQILNDYYEKIRVEREIGKYIYQKLFENEPAAIILTGHAGDGKTSILVQILNELGYFSHGKRPLKQYELFENKLFYVKDMSELNEETQEDMLIKVLESPINNISSVLVTNTGPLINTFKRINKKNNTKSINNDDLEIGLLNSIDSIECETQNFEANGNTYKYKVINLAKIDNSYFIKEIIEKLTNEELWKPCENCDNKEKCPIYFNIQSLWQNKSRVENILEKLYLWLSEYETRLTIRQMLSHLSFSITGNLSCKKIKKEIIYKENPLFDYSMANLMFGYKGNEFIKDSFNIRAIRELEKFKLDEKSLIEDDNILFVKEDYSYFHKDIAAILYNTLNLNIQSLEINNPKAVSMRRAFRRFYILFSNPTDEKQERLLKQIFGDVFPLYYEMITHHRIRRNNKNYLVDIVFEGLYKVFVGVNPLKKEDKLYLTLRKNLDMVQNVQLILGTVRREDFNIINIRQNDNIERSTRLYQTKVKIKDVEYDLNLQTLEYLYKLKEGKIFTSFNPNFTFGLSKVKTDLLKTCKYKEEDDLKLLLLKDNSIEEIDIYFNSNELYARLGRWWYGIKYIP